MKNKSKKIKYLIVTLFVLIFLTVVATVGIGGYFVNYALVPNQGGENRNVKPLKEDKKELNGKFNIEAIENRDKKDRDIWVANLGTLRKEMKIKSKDGLNFYGHQILQKEPTNKWVIIAHGYQSSENESNIIARHFYNLGYNVLTYNQRAHGTSEGKCIGMGYLEKDDLLEWTDALISEYPNSEIIYHGTSMGGATVLMASGLSLPKQVKAIISDSAFSSIWDIFSSELKARFNLPAFPVLYMSEIMCKIKAGYFFHSGNVVSFVKKSKLPILFIHTRGDDFVPLEMAEKLYNAKSSGKKDLLIFNAGKHAEAKYNSDYYTKIQIFLNDI